MNLSAPDRGSPSRDGKFHLTTELLSIQRRNPIFMKDTGHFQDSYLRTNCFSGTRNLVLFSGPHLLVLNSIFRTGVSSTKRHLPNPAFKTEYFPATLNPVFRKECFPIRATLFSGQNAFPYEPPCFQDRFVSPYEPSRFQDQTLLFTSHPVFRAEGSSAARQIPF